MIPLIAQPDGILGYDLVIILTYRLLFQI